jgi:catechol 2,3-dioxygenase-like lactoylglutathione lyase family enzyme
MARITGLGGIFYKVADPEATKAWYADILGMKGDYGPMLPWSLDQTGEAFSLVSPFNDTTDYFAPSESSFMINLRVDDLEAYVAELEAKGVEILGRQDEDYGRFAWLLDCDGNKVELWQQRGPAPPV